jgi:hypothetical protein
MATLLFITFFLEFKYISFSLIFFYSDGVLLKELMPEYIGGFRFLPFGLNLLLMVLDYY